MPELRVAGDNFCAIRKMLHQSEARHHVPALIGVWNIGKQVGADYAGRHAGRRHELLSLPAGGFEVVQPAYLVAEIPLEIPHEPPRPAAHFQKPQSCLFRQVPFEQPVEVTEIPAPRVEGDFEFPA